ncbi:hypothetical protein DL95DRAFT_390468 [Leptodontidium sp. 2 PMI_412]|nr:hypothetical protein DL95DRAFT_390468 [Leptodontidium sp. 2 PMI_412]
MARADKLAAIAVAVVVIQRGEVVDYFAAAAKFKYDRTSISKRIQKVLIDRINYLTDRGLPPTSSIVKSLIKEIKGSAVGKN